MWNYKRIRGCLFSFMQLTEQQIQAVKNNFSTMQSIDDFVTLLNFVNKLIYAENYKSKINTIRKKSVTFYANPKLSGEKRYVEFSIKKKTGGDRKIAAPHESLKLIQSALNFIFSVIYEPKEYVTGFVPDKSIVDNAKVHVGRNYVYNIDLENFFPSIELNRIKAVLKLPPFSLEGTEREKIAYLIACLACKDGRLPQGSPTSPVLSNIVCQKMDRRLRGFSKAFDCRFTRYADDITFSASKDVFNQTFKTELKRIIEDQNFTINEKKVRLQGTGYKQEVTGLIVNEKLNVSKKYVRDLRAMLNNWEKLGYEKAFEKFAQHYYNDKGYPKKQGASMQNVVWGKLQFLKMVKGKKDAVVLKYEAQYQKLNPKPLQVDLDNLSLSDILAIRRMISTEKELKMPWENNTQSLSEMQKGKIDFIVDLLVDNQIETPLKEKVSNLATKELKKIFNVDRENHFGVLEIGRKMLGKEDITKKSIIDLSKHLPVETTKFLQLFSNEDSNFKYLVHDYLNGPFEINDFINNVKAELNNYESSNVKYSLRKRIESFIDIHKAGKYKQWYFNNISSRFSFSNIEVLEWALKRINSGRHPIHNFEKEILFFKNSIRIYDGSLKNYINEIAAQQLGDLYTSFEIVYENVEKAEFYTDVDSLLSGIRGIFNSIKQRANKSNKIKIEFRARNTPDGRLIILNIIHINSICEKPLNKSEIFGSDNGGDFKAIEQRFFQVCDWSITANNPDTDFNKLNILYDINKDMQPGEKIDSSKIQGFTHTMTFYS
jgi:RNA-directed DNA polymerase